MSITTVLFAFFRRINEFTQWGKSDISPIGKLETRDKKAETVNTEHIQTNFFQSLRLIGVHYVRVGFHKNSSWS